MFLNIQEKSITHVVGKDADGGDVEKRFYEMRAGLVPRMKTIALPLVKSLTVLFGKKDGDRATQHREHVTEGSREVNYTILAPSPELVRERHAQQQAAVESLFAGITDQATLAAVADIIADSLRDDFPDAKARAAAAVKIREEMTLPQMVPFLIGVGKANAALFGPFQELVPDMVASFKRKLVEAAPAASGAPAETKDETSAASAVPPIPQSP